MILITLKSYFIIIMPMVQPLCVATINMNSVFSTLLRVCVSALLSRSVTGQCREIVPVDVTSDWAELVVKLTCQTSVSAFYNELTFLYLFTHSIPHCVYYWTPVFVSYWLFKNKRNLRNQKKNQLLICYQLVVLVCFLFFNLSSIHRFAFQLYIQLPWYVWGHLYYLLFVLCATAKKWQTIVK